MNRRLPPEALEFYYGLGVDRSYQAVADKFGVSKVTVTRQAKEERWQEKLRALEQKARENFEKRALEEMDAVRERQLRSARAVQAKGLEALRSLPPEKAVKAAAAMAIGWKHELLLLGQPTDRAEVDVAEIVKRESERWLLPAGREPDDAGDGGAE